MDVLSASARLWDECGDSECRRIPVERLVAAARDRVGRRDIESALEVVIRCLDGHRDDSAAMSQFVLPRAALDRLTVGTIGPR